MADDITRTTHQTSHRRRRFIPRRKRVEPSVPSGLLTVAGRPLAPSDFLDNPIAAVAGVEELCWQFTRRDWLARRPARYRLKARRAWGAEGEVLDEKRQRIADMVAGPHGRSRS